MDEIPIGRFARLTGLTVKALRHYDAIGLLRPAAVDPHTRHRRYAPDQLEPARRIRRLREVDLPLDRVAAVLAAPDDGRALLLAYRRDVQARLARDQRILHRLTHLAKGDEMTEAPSTTLPADEERRLAAALFNEVWTLLEQPGRTEADDDRMVHAAHASRHHWGQVGGPKELAIGEWQISRVYAVLGRAEPALHHARRSLATATGSEVPDWLVASAHEALARAYAVAGNRPAAVAERDLAAEVLARVTDPEDREVVEADLAGLPL